MRSFKPLARHGLAMVQVGTAVLREEGFVTFARKSVDAARGLVRTLRSDSDSILMDSSDVRRRWKDRSGTFSPSYYAMLGPNETSERLREVLDEHVESDAAVLEVGCSSGRHLTLLHEHGFDDLHGIEINEEAIEVMEKTYPDLAADGSFYVDAVENVVTEFDDGQFDVVYAVETLELVHPDNDWLFEELARITDHLLITVENEYESSSVPFIVGKLDDFPIYFRNWKSIFTELGFVERISEQHDMDMFRVFEKAQRAVTGSR